MNHCPVCEGPGAKVYLQDRVGSGSIEVGSSRRNVSPGTIRRCGFCGFGFRQNRSSAETLNQLYQEMDTTVYESELAGRTRTARSHLSIVTEYLRRGRILDVGCASGLFLRLAADGGLDVAGVETSHTLCSQARDRLAGRAELHCTSLENAQLSGRYDALTLWDVLEHVPTPISFLRRCQGLVRPEGYVFLNVPDLDSLEAVCFGRRWPLLLPEHLNYFNRRSLRQALERAGLKVVRFGRRAAWFSLGYLAYRLKQHRVPGSIVIQHLASALPGGAVFPIMLGEIYVVAQAGNPAGPQGPAER